LVGATYSGSHDGALEDSDLRRYAAWLGLDVALFDGDQGGAAAL
jgi:hypothetical protein